MEVTSASRGNNRLFHSVSNPFSGGSENQLSNFELLLDLPTVSTCCPAQVDEIPPPEPTQTDPTSDEVTPSEDNSLKDSSETNSDKDEDKRAESVASEMAVIQAPLPKLDENAEKKTDEPSSDSVSITSSSPARLTPKPETTAAEATARTDKSAQQVQVKQVKAVDKDAANDQLAQADVESALPKTDAEIIDAPQAELNRDANKKVLKVDGKNGTAEEPAQQSEASIRVTEKSESSEKGSQESLDQSKNEQAQTTAVEKDRRSDSRERPARWYEQDSSQQSGEHGAKEIADAKSDSKDAQLAKMQADSATGGNESLAKNGSAEASQADALASDLPTGAIQATDTALASSTSTATFATSSSVAAADVAASDVAALGSIDSESATSEIRPAFSTEQKLANKITGIPGNNLQSSQTGQQVDLSRAEKVRLAQRVARSFSRVGPTGGSVQLKLHPPELGSLAVNIKIEGKSMSAKLTTESQAAREVIMESLPQLRTRLAEQGYDVVQFTVDVASDSATMDNQSGQGTGQSGAGQGGQSGGSSESSSRSLPGTDLRRSNYLRRQIDAASQVARPTVASFSSRSIDVQA